MVTAYLKHRGTRLWRRRHGGKDTGVQDPGDKEIQETKSDQKRYPKPRRRLLEDSVSQILRPTWRKALWAMKVLRAAM